MPRKRDASTMELNLGSPKRSEKAKFMSTSDSDAMDTTEYVPVSNNVGAGEGQRVAPDRSETGRSRPKW